MTQKNGSVEKVIPDIVIHRLPVYLRALDLMARQGKRITSSQELGERLGISSAQIRKDLSHFGEFGKQGTGYDVEYLRDQLRRILKVERVWPMALVGAGDLGHALANYKGFANRGFQVAAVFDADPNKIGQRIGSLVVESMDVLTERIAEAGIRIGIIAVPAEAAQDVANRLIEGGVRAILNYAPITLSVPQEVRVEYIDPVLALQSMTYYLEPDEAEVPA
nr:redox-sensing transcriptional repressor Rex [Ardenticatena sp.]